MTADDPIAELRRKLQDAGYGYGDADEFERRREREFPALQDTVYLDYAASPPAPPAAVQAFLSDMSSTLYSNPHSRSTAAVATSLAIDRVRTRVLVELFGLESERAKEWDVVFTSGATSSLKLVGDAFPWRREGRTRLRYLKNSHTSLVGIRGLALANGVDVQALEEAEMLGGWSDEPDVLCLAAYPAQCNATGARLGLELCRKIKQRSPKTAVLVDAAAYLSTNVLNLGALESRLAPDFIAMSFYKLFGWPTGLGALVVKRASGHLLSNDAYFGGGTVEGFSTGSPFWVTRRRGAGYKPTVHERLEAGTLPFLDIVGLGHALDTHRALYGSHSLVSAHATSLASFVADALGALRHANGSPVFRRHMGYYLEQPGATIGFSLLDSRGAHSGHVQFDRLATINGFQLRTGRLCNTGAWISAAGFDDEDLVRMRDKQLSCWDDDEFDEQARPLGIARISFGASSTLADALAFVEFVRRFYTESEAAVSLTSTPVSLRTQSLWLDKLTLYPIKSCAGQTVSSWTIGSTGLAFDREWMVVDPRTEISLSQKRWPRMVLIRPSVDLVAGILRVTAPGMPDLVLPLPRPTSFDASSEARVCGDTVPVAHVSAAADEWFTSFLGTPCELQRYIAEPSSGSSRHAHFDGPPLPLLLSNESPFLLISSSSTRKVNEWIAADTTHAAIPSACFRANLELADSDGVPPFFEDDVDLFRIGDQVFQVLGACRRCLMVSINQDTGTKTTEPYSTLSRKRKNAKGKITFGAHLMWREDLSRSSGKGEGMLNVGDPVTIVEASPSIPCTC
ncbi:molybdenum cofactor sulfurase [Hyaloraphidium curvatum]|nr:molybdenum cofactor sulfurase [Hyaloraphidium curvatum]